MSEHFEYNGITYVSRELLVPQKGDHLDEMRRIYARQYTDPVLVQNKINGLKAQQGSPRPPIYIQHIASTLAFFEQHRQNMIELGEWVEKGGAA